MSIQVALHHKTEYTYDKAISIYPHIVRLRPALHTRTPILSYSLKVEPKEHFLNWQQDPFGNYQARFVFLEKASHLSIEVDLLAEMTVINPFDFFLESYAEEAPFSYDDSLLDELQPYLQIKDSSDVLKEYVSQISLKKQRTVDFLVDINQKIYKDISYIIRIILFFIISLKIIQIKIILLYVNIY
jgi:transglutaminase-like putative cysteine protease